MPRTMKRKKNHRRSLAVEDGVSEARKDAGNLEARNRQITNRRWLIEPVTISHTLSAIR